ncbi:hypothetical protein PI124_g4176 [Phytophthora idaei]|nr:hypothetical protein PI125_g3819 [Phytophthora idaei]KAG3165494.1 hypothetical protein PI126_g4635 [Phytophthora idaei]KAG3251214.1 hypothetical protein PI124_g4176 [Phytophthora idaei]
MDQEERRKRHELSYGVYNFRDVKQHFSRLGWTFRPGPPLSYDHYYIMPGKNPRNKEHKQGVDYFLGEAELVAYARKKKIFGVETVPLPVANGLGRDKRRARSSSSARTSQVNLYWDSDSSDNDSTQRQHKREHKRHRRRSDKHKVGNSSQNPIALFSDSSDDEYSGAAMDTASSVEEEKEEWTEGGVDVEDDQESEEEAVSSPSEEDTNDESDDGDLEIAASSQISRKLSNGKSRSYVYTEPQQDKRKEKAKSKPKERTRPTLIGNIQANYDDASDDSETEEHGQNRTNPRPLLTTSHKKRNGVMHTSKKQRQNGSKAASGNAKGPSKPRGQKRAATVSAQNKTRGLVTIIGKKSKSAPRSLLQETDNSHGGMWEENDDDNSFDLGVAEYGESPPRRPPSRVHSRANSIKSSPATSVVATSPPPDIPEEQKEEAVTDSAAPAAVSAISQSVLSSSANTPSTTTSTSPELAKRNITDSGTPAQVSMELTQVELPPDRDNRYHIGVTVTADKPPVHTIWMENLSTHEQREYSFVDVTELPGAKNDIRVPTTTVLTALFRCLSSQPDAVVVVGPEPRATAESKTAFEKGEVQLLTSTAEKDSGEAGGSDGLTLVVAYPALDLFRVNHNFPMKLVSESQRLQHLAHEVERLSEQLSLVQTDRDKLCEQLRQLEEENERTLSQQVEARVRARMETQNSRPQERQSSEDVERRVTKLVEEKTQAFIQAQEKEIRNRERARRWVFVQSYWMSAFPPCQALVTGATADTRTSLLRPGTVTTPRTYVVEWKDVIDIAEPFFQTTDTSEGGSTRFISVVKDGMYQVNANVSHDSLVQLRLVINPARPEEGSPALREAREIAPTKVSLYDNKRRVSRVDMMLELCASDQLSLELRLLDSTVPPLAQEEWLRAPMPTHSRLLVLAL